MDLQLKRSKATEKTFIGGPVLSNVTMQSSFLRRPVCLLLLGCESLVHQQLHPWPTIPRTASRCPGQQLTLRLPCPRGVHRIHHRTAAISPRHIATWREVAESPLCLPQIRLMPQMVDEGFEADNLQRRIWH